MKPIKGWTLFCKDGLRAHFLQPDGSSRPGTDWAVKLTLRSEQRTVLVRAYADDMVGTTPQQQSQLVLGYVARLIESGWSPSQYNGKPGDLVYIPAPSSAGILPPDKAKSWWRFW